MEITQYERKLKAEQIEELEDCVEILREVATDIKEASSTLDILLDRARDGEKFDQVLTLAMFSIDFRKYPDLLTAVDDTFVDILRDHGKLGAID